MRFLIDTHVLAWALIERGQDVLPPRVRDVLRSGVLLYSPIRLYEIAQKVRIGRWPLIWEASRSG